MGLASASAVSSSLWEWSLLSPVKPPVWLPSRTVLQNAQLLTRWAREGTAHPTTQPGHCLQ